MVTFVCFAGFFLHQADGIDLNVDVAHFAAVGFGIGEGDVESFAQSSAGLRFENELDTELVL